MKPVLAVVVLLALVWAVDLARPLGAHPWWSRDVVAVGGPIGLALAWLGGLKLRAPPLVVLFALVLLAALGIAVVGKMTFAASYAEDAVAGKLWFYGWIAIMAGFGGLTLTITRLVFRGRDPG